LILLLALALVARVVGVTDGDTLTVRGGGATIKVRLNGIDCPEKGQPFGRAASEYTAKLAFGRDVRVVERSRDRYGRVVADVFLPDGKCLNQELVRAGLAWWFQRYAPRDLSLRKLEEEAREARRGLWADKEPIPPWAWRKLSPK
jgi:endonuclease YncB( thermonuclease family)